MSDSYSKYCEDKEEYTYLCKLLKVDKRDDWFDHFIELKHDDRIVWKDYRYQLKSE